SAFAARDFHPIDYTHAGRTRKTDPPHLASLFFYSTKRDLGHFFWHYGISFSCEEMFEKYSKIN
ncbi:hypothetical protein, partial [Bacillus smithii]|uniref:hypothetical protein n=1 Tax=Bacillus smithii TaxID=1479 RepID=UPI002E2116BB|nr:hypothetical protein [Bacillus smithii]